MQSNVKNVKKKLVRYVFHTDVEQLFKPRICIDNIRQIGLAEHPHMTRNLLARKTESASFTYLASNMKRSMSQSTMCMKCFEPVQKGWQQTYHMQLCRGRPDTTNFTQVKTTLQHNIDDDDHTNQAGTEVDDPGENQLAEQVQDIRQGGTIATDEVVVQRAKGKVRVLLTPKTREILEFLSTAEKGEGCSREHAQGWLDYKKKKGGQSAQLLPKDIRTCWKHVAKVNSALHLPEFALHCLAPPYVSTIPLLHLLCLPFHCHA